MRGFDICLGKIMNPSHVEHLVEPSMVHPKIYPRMANKRTLKKNINYICSELFSECVAEALYNNKQEQGTEMLPNILAMHSNYIRRVSHPEPGLKAKAYYKDLNDRFYAETEEMVNNIINM